ncbi:retropepsin-like aspartic protease [Caulobacter sp. Root1455]|uniref:retropepsin-like aspartic protease n=1 Tax=Caulobacter sp. Root1455 TaxID=1736465 RepID=UPI002E132376
MAISSLPARAAEQRLPAAFADGSNHVFLKVSINNAPEAWMLLDTGTVPSTIDRAYAQSLGLKLGKESNTGKGAGTGPIVIAKTKVQSVRVGAATQQDVAFESMVFSFPTPDGQPAVGVLGYSFLAGRILIVDYQKREVLFTDAGLSSAQGFPFRMVYNIPTVRAALGGEQVDALIDTGGYYDVLLTPPAAKRLGLEKAMADGAAATGFGYGGAQDYKLGKGPDLSLGDLVKPSPAIAFIPLPIKIDGALGTVFLKDYRMTLDYPAKRVLFER